MRNISYLINFRNLFSGRVLGFPMMFSFLFLSFCAHTQETDSAYVKRMTDSLTTPQMAGRGYVENGMGKAADFISRQLKNMDLPVQEQAFSFPVNTFPGKTLVRINGEDLRPGIDFLITPDSKGIRGKYTLRQDSAGSFSAKNIHLQEVNKLTWSVALKQGSSTGIQVLKSALKSPPRNIELDIEAKQLDSFEARNIIAFVPGTTQPDSFLVLTAHYDHLGKMGKEAVFHGANDNASGTALLLSLAARIKENPLPYTVVYLFFAAEEAGILGSQYFVEMQSMDFQRIRFLLNLDLMGNGEDGITVVNATEFPHDFELLKKINDSCNYLTAINARGKAANSDHYWFTEVGVPSFFWYTLGSRMAYHDVEDIPATLLYPEAEDLIDLVFHFLQAVSRTL